MENDQYDRGPVLEEETNHATTSGVDVPQLENNDENASTSRYGRVSVLEEETNHSTTSVVDVAELDNEDTIHMDIRTKRTDTIAEKIAAWSIEENIPFRSVNKLLAILKPVIPDLPGDARSLKHTPRSAPTIPMKGGSYIHYGIKDSLTDLLEKFHFPQDILELNFNVDGLPVSKSSGAQVWPILMNISNTDSVLLVFVYEGYSKPKDTSEFLQMFVEELKELQEDGFEYCGRYFLIKIGVFVCDAPARAMVLGIKSHSGFYSCHKCTQRGESLQHRIVFRLSENDLRTDEGYRSRKYPDHHTNKEQNMLELLQFDMVNNFPLDYMHVVCLGVMKALIRAWSKDRRQPYSLSLSKIEVLNLRLMEIRSDVPREFCRKPRSISEIDRWKATELKMFLLYIGPIALENILDSERYDHFLSLSAAIRILLSDNTDNINEAERLLSDFVEKMPNLYNESFLTYNIHCLTHLAADVRNIGPLSKFDAFKFENFLQAIKRKLKQKRYFCSQIYKRMVEASLNSVNISSQNKINEYNVGAFKDGSYLFLQTKNYYFSLKHPNNFYTYSGKVYKVHAISKISGEYVVCGYPIVTRTFFTNDNNQLNILTNNCIRIEGELEQHLPNNINKIFKIKVGRELYFVTLIH